MGAYDIASTVDLIHTHTNKSLIYIGFSLGTIAGHVYSSVYPEEAGKNIKVMISMAPATLIETSKSILRYLRPYWGTLQVVASYCFSHIYSNLKHFTKAIVFRD